MPGTIRSMQLEHVLRDVQTDRGSLLHGRLLWWQFDAITLAHRCRRGASTPSPNPDHDLERPAASPDPGGPYRAVTRGRRIVPAELVPNLTSTPVSPAFSRTFVEVSEDD